MAGETASDHHVVTLGRHHQKGHELQQKMLEVTIHREHVPTGRGPRPMRNCPANAIRRRAIQRLNSRVRP
jgi:hypothetical protein